MAQVIGLSTAASAESLGDDYRLNDIETTIQAKILADYGTDHGFFSAAVDPESPVDDSYTATRSYKRTTKHTTVEDNYQETSGSEEEERVYLGKKRVTHTETKIVSEDESTSYGLSDMVSRRRDKVEAYVASLTYQGLRG